MESCGGAGRSGRKQVTLFICLEDLVTYLLVGNSSVEYLSEYCSKTRPIWKNDRCASEEKTKIQEQNRQVVKEKDR